MTAPKRYKVSPKRGVIQPLGKVIVTVNISYSSYLPNKSSSEKKERESNGVFVDRYQFESIFVQQNEIPENYMRDKQWWLNIFKSSENCSVVKSRGYFSLGAISMEDINILNGMFRSGHEEMEPSKVELIQEKDFTTEVCLKLFAMCINNIPLIVALLFGIIIGKYFLR